MGLLRHRTRRNADCLDWRSEIEIRHDHQRLEGDPPWPTRVLHSVGLSNRHHHPKDPSPHTGVEHETVIVAHSRAPREATLPQDPRPPLLDPSRGEWATRVSDRL